MKHTPQQLEEMLNAWEDAQGTAAVLERPVGEIIQSRHSGEEASVIANDPQVNIAEPTPVRAEPDIQARIEEQSSNPITSFDNDLLPSSFAKPKRKGARRIEFIRDPSTDRISGGIIYDSED